MDCSTVEHAAVQEANSGDRISDIKHADTPLGGAVGNSGDLWPSQCELKI